MRRRAPTLFNHIVLGVLKYLVIFNKARKITSEVLNPFIFLFKHCRFFVSFSFFCLVSSSVCIVHKFFFHLTENF